MLRKLSFLRRRLREQGPSLFIRARLLNAWFFLLQRVYGFAKWNILCNYLERPYKAKAVSMIAALQPDTVVEIGCGLGEILARVPARVRLGFDIDGPVVAAANFLHGKKARFFHASFLEPQSFLATLASAGVESIDVLVLINWIHEVHIDHIIRSLAAIRAQVPVRYVLMDAIKPEFTGYKYCHSLPDLERFGEIVESVDADEVRSLHVFTLTSFETNQLSRLGQAVSSAAPSPSFPA